MKNLVLNTLLVTASTCLALFAVNYYFELQYQEKLLEETKRDTIPGYRSRQDLLLRKNKAQDLGIDYDMRRRWQVVLDDRQTDKDTVSFICPKIISDLDWDYPYYPLSGVSSVPTVLCNENGDFSRYLSDRHGFNNTDTVWESAARGDQTDILLLGDSYTHGSCVSRDENIAGNMEKTGLSVANLGCGGNGPISSLAAFKEYGAAFKAKKVIYVFTEENDIGDISWELEVPQLAKYFEDENHRQGLADIPRQEIDKKLKRTFEALLAKSQTDSAQQPGDLTDWTEQINRNLALKEEHHRKGNNSKARRLLTLFHIRNQLSLVRTNQPEPQTDSSHATRLSNNIERVISVVRQMKETADRAGSDFVFVFLPGRPVVRGMIDRAEREKTGWEYGFKKTLFDRLGEHGINIIDTESWLTNYEPQNELYPLEYDGHFSVLGYKEFTRHVLEAIDNRDFSEVRTQ